MSRYCVWTVNIIMTYRSTATISALFLNPPRSCNITNRVRLPADGVTSIESIWTEEIESRARAAINTTAPTARTI